MIQSFIDTRGDGSHLVLFADDAAGRTLLIEKYHNLKGDMRYQEITIHTGRPFGEPARARPTLQQQTRTVYHQTPDGDICRTQEPTYDISLELVAFDKGSKLALESLHRELTT